jgi:cation transport regulator
MPFQTSGGLPDAAKHVLPTHAQYIYKEAFNHAYDEYKNAENRRGHENRETIDHKVAWAAVKQKYAKGGGDKLYPIG